MLPIFFLIWELESKNLKQKGLKKKNCIAFYQNLYLRYIHIWHLLFKRYMNKLWLEIYYFYPVTFCKKEKNILS